MTYKITEQQIATAAELACFYITPQGLWLRITYCDMDEGYFQALDENTHEEYTFHFDEMVAEKEVPHFEHLIRTEL